MAGTNFKYVDIYKNAKFCNFNMDYCLFNKDKNEFLNV